MLTFAEESYMKLYELLEKADILTCSRPDLCLNLAVSGISSDSRCMKEDCVFVCVRGTRTDGHLYIQNAIAGGAAVVILEDPSFISVCGDTPWILSENTHALLSEMWLAYYHHPEEKLKLIAVTGTNGKTSVTHLLRAIFSKAGYQTGMIGTVHNIVGGDDCPAVMTTPDPDEIARLLFRMAKCGTEYVFMEASSHALSLDRLSGLFFAAGIFTNLTPEHLDFHGTMENYLAAKQKLFFSCARSLFCADSSYASAISSHPNITGKKYFFSAEDKAEADFIAKNIKYKGVEGSEYEFLTNSVLFHVKTPLPGHFSVCNTLAAASCAFLFGVPQRIIADSIAGFSAVPGRIEALPVPADFSVFLDYAHTPDALQNILLTLKSAKQDGARLILVFGCGGDRDATKRPVMGRIASRTADFCIITSDNSRSEDPLEIIRQILRGIDKEAPHAVICDRTEAIRYALDTARPGDIVLLAGKGHEDYEITVDGKHPFSEKQIVSQYFQNKNSPANDPKKKA